MDESILSIAFFQFELILGGAVIAGVALVVLRMLRRVRRTRRRIARRKLRQAAASLPGAVPQSAGPARQAPVADQGIRVDPIPVLADDEARLFVQLSQLAAKAQRLHVVLPRQSLSSFLIADPGAEGRARLRETAARLAALEVEFLIVDATWRPILACAMEDSRALSGAEDDDEASYCARAGIAFVRVPPGGVTSALRRHIAEILDRSHQIAAQ